MTYTPDFLATWRVPFGKYRDRPLSEVPRGYLHWMLGLDNLRPDTRDVLEAFLGLAPAPPPGDTPPAALQLCVRWKDGYWCLGVVFNGACVRCGAKGEGATFVRESA